VQRAAREQLRALFFLRCLLMLHGASKELRPRRARPSEEAGGGAAAGGGGGDVMQTFLPGLRDVPAEVAEHLLELFSERRSGRSSRDAAGGGFGGAADAEGDGSGAEHFVRTPELVDRLGCYIASVALACEGHAAPVELRLLAADMAAPVAKVARYFRELGCSVDAAKGKAELLVLPLRFPKLSRGRAT
jgi:hypothetical protein